MDDLLIARGYSKKDIENMETEEYDYITNLTVRRMSSKKHNNPFAGGL